MIDKVTFLIPTRNRSDDLTQCLSQLSQSALGSLTLIVYDDASDNPTLTERACLQFSNVELIKGTTRTGQAGGRNILLNACRTPYAILMDDDTWFRQAESLADIIERNLVYDEIGRASVVCSQIIRTTDNLRLFPQNMTLMRILNPIGMGCIINVQDVLGIGGFRSFFVYRHEETELGLRLWAEDLKVVYDPSLVVAHNHTGAARSSNEYDRLSARNLIMMHTLNLPGLAGFPLGMGHALRLLLLPNVSRAAIIAGIWAGIRATIKYRDEATVMSYAKYRELRQFREQMNS